MFIDNISSQPAAKVSQLLETLKNTYHVDLTKASATQLQALAAKYQDVKQRIVAESEFNSYASNPEYARAVLILEAVRLLIEIAPKRMSKRNNSSTNITNEAGMIRNKYRNNPRLHEQEDLEQAQSILAAKDLSDRLQKMAEDSAKMAVDDLMPLVDTMKEQFGIDRANAFNEIVKSTLQGVLDSIIKAKDETENAILTLQQGGTPQASTDIESGAPAPGGEGAPATPEGGEDFEATPARSGPEEEPLGRSMKGEPGLAEGKKGKIPPQFLANIKKKKAEAGKKPVKESNYKCLECVTGMYEADHQGKMTCNECGSMMVIGEGTMKNIKRGLSGWPSYGLGPEGSKQGKPRDVLDRVKQMDDQMLKDIASVPEKDLGAGSPAALQQKAAQQELRRRGIKENESTELVEKWGTKMKTAPKDMGKWEGYTISELKARKKKLMDKEERSAAEQKEVKQLNFAIRAKQEDNWGKIKEEGKVTEASNGKPTTPKEKKLAAMAPPRDKITQADVLKGRGAIDEGMCSSCKKKPCVCEAVKEADEVTPATTLATMAATGKDVKGKPLTPAQKTAAQKAAQELAKAPITEKAQGAKSPYAVGMSQAKKEAGITAKPAHDLPKKVIKRGHEIARSIEKGKKEESQIRKVNAIIESLQGQYQSLKNEFGAHKKQFKNQIQEGKKIDPLGTGHGLEGDAILEKLSLLKKKISEAINLKSKMVQSQQAKQTQLQEARQEIKTFDQQLKNSPYGLVGIDKQNQKVTKFFESTEERTMWISYHNKSSLRDVHLINPQTIKNAQNYLKNKIQKS